MAQVETNPDAVVVEQGGRVEASIIWLHGLGADGHDFESLVPELGLPESCGIRFIFPHAPYRAVTINGGMRMRAWYDISPGEFGFDTDMDGVVESASLIRALIEGELNKGIQSERLLLAGFSQGGAVALYTALRYPETLAGILALSTYLPGMPETGEHLSDENKATPIFLAHGLHDPLVPIQWGRDTGARLEKLGYQVEWHDYEMEHSVCMPEIQDIAVWLKAILCS